MSTLNFMHKWKMFGCDLKGYLQAAQVGLGSPVTFEVGKHFSHRVADRFTDEDYSTIRRMLYHVINKDLCKILYWYHTSAGNEGLNKNLLINYKNICIVSSLGHKDNNIVIRTIYKQNKTPDEERFFVIKIDKESK
jgi:hypothetical protein